MLYERDCFQAGIVSLRSADAEPLKHGDVLLVRLLYVLRARLGRGVWRRRAGWAVAAARAGRVFEGMSRELVEARAGSAGVCDGHG